MVSGALRSALVSGDVLRCKKIWAEAFPNMPQPTLKQAEVMLHQARTAAMTVPLEKRLYSHSWLDERGHESKLPDDLRPEPKGPVIIPAVGVSVNTTSKRKDRREEAKYVEKIMADAAGDAMLSGVTDPARISKIMWQARDAVRL